MDEIGWKDIWYKGAATSAYFHPKQLWLQNQPGVVESEEKNANTKKNERRVCEGVERDEERANED